MHDTVRIDYTNWRGERGERTVTPIVWHFGANQWHPEPQWLMDALDHDKGERRTFAVAAIHSFSLPINQR